MASVMRLGILVKVQCGETLKFDWRCEILSEAGAPCGYRFQSKRALRCHQLRSKLHGHGRQTSVLSSVITNYCPWCRSTFSSTMIARKHAAASTLSGQRRVDAGAVPWPISPPKSLQCRLCDDDDTTYLLMPPWEKIRKKQTDSSQVGGWRTWFCAATQGNRSRSTRGRGRPAGSKKMLAAFCKNTTQLMGIIIKQCLRTQQDTRSLCGAIFDTVIMATEHDVVKSKRAQRRLYNEGVLAAGKGHTLGPPQIWAWGGLIAGLQKQGAATLTGYLKQLDGMSMDTKCDRARFCRVDRTYQSEQARITLSVERSGVRDPVVSALQQLGAARKYGRAPPTQLSRESNNGWTPYSTSGE